MSRVEAMVERLCPEGVQVLALNEIAMFGTGTQLSRSDMDPDGLYPVLNGGVTYSGRTSLSNSPAKTIAISQGGASAGHVTWVDEMFWAGAHCYVLRPKLNVVDARYLFFVLKKEQRALQASKRGAGIPGLGRAQLSELQIPVPPMEVQLEIVRALDHFADLEAELEAELDARNLQFKFYRSQLLKPKGSWRPTTIGEMAEVFDGPHATPSKTSSGPWYLSISSLKNGQFDLSESAHLADDDFPAWTRRVEPERGDTLFSYETRIGEAAYWDTDEPAALGRRMGLLRPRRDVVDPRFLTLAYLGPQLQSLIESKTVRGSTVDRIPIAEMRSWPISIPSMAEQSHIVALDEKFVALLNVGLPAELAARRSQHEYYRNRLLTFTEAAA